MKTLIKGGRVIDPANSIDAITDILIDGSRISRIADNIDNEANKIIDAAGKLVIPGLIDMHVHLREPGREDKETLASGTRAALSAGVTGMLAMPNTQPSIDCVDNARLLKGLVKGLPCVNIFICASITKERAGRELVDISGLKKEGAIAISDDGSSVDSPEIMSEALAQAKKAGVLVICHSEDKKLSNNGVVNLGFTSTRMGLRGISNESEYKRAQRDIELAAKAACSVHITHVSCKESVEIIAAFKKKGVKVTCDTAPHYFSLTQEAVLGYDTNFKMNPPLRSEEDLQAIRLGLKDGTIDAIASDHAPHTENEKEIEFERAEFGVIGLETELAAGITYLIENKVLDWSQLVERLALNPARILGVDKGTLGIGKDADIIVVAPDKEWVVKKEGIVSKSKNSPFLGKKLKGLVEYTILGGKIVYEVSSHQRAGKAG